MDINKNYYQILGVDKNADEDTIRKEYKKLAFKHHPDKNPDDKTSENIFKSINEAYQIIGDKDKRNEYDQKSQHGRNYNPFSNNGGFGFQGGFGGFGNSIFDIFEQFGFTTGFNRKQQVIENLDLVMNVNISLSDVYNNRNIPIKYNRLEPCDTCQGTGFDFSSESFDCEHCKGRGYDVYRIPCEYCKGTGKLYTGKCKVCNGDKVVNKIKEFSLNNIYRIRESRNEYLQHYGNYSKHYKNKVGNLQVNIIYNHDHRYEIRNNDLYYKLNLHYQDAIDGIEYKHVHLDGKILKIKIPPKTKDKDIIRLQKKGLFVNTIERGHLLFDINIIIDYSRINTSQ